MTNNVLRSDPLRFRLYYWLMNLCVFFVPVASFAFIIAPYEPEAAPAWYLIIVYVAVVFNSVVPLFLMLASFMRDDYTESLWRRSLVVLAYCAAVIPPILFFTPWIIFHAVSGDASLRPDFYAAFEDVFYNAKLAPVEVLANAWIAFLMIFVVIFQFLRWRDSK